MSKKNVLSNALLLNLISQLIFLVLLYPVMVYFHIFGNNINLFVLLLFLQQIQITLAQFSRGIGKVKEFAINGIIMTLITATLNIILLVNLDMKLMGYLWSLIVANLVSCVYLFLIVDGKRNFRIKYANLDVFKDMARYSAPLIPNMVMWWVISGSTRYFILFFLGSTVNGLFAVANKIPSILSMFTTIFQQAWQLSAYEEYKSKNSKDFFSTVFTVYSQFIFIGCSVIMILIRFVVPNIIDTAFFYSWKIMPILLLSVVYQSFSSFIGTNYTASMKTKGVLSSSILGGIVSVVCNLLFIPIFGLIGTGIGTLCSFFVMFIYRYFDTKKIFSFNINMKNFILNNLILLVQVISLFFIKNEILLLILEVILVCLIVYVNKQLIFIFFSRKRAE